MGRHSLIRFVAALAVTLVLGGTALWVATSQRSTAQSTKHRPTPATSQAYVLAWRSGDSGPFQQAVIDKDGADCEVIQASNFLYRACVLATNVDPAIIASEAFGHINMDPTPSLEAVIWRGILSQNTGVCPRAGLRDDALDECMKAVDAGRRTVTDRTVTVRIGD